MKKIVYYIAALAAVVACNTIEPETEPEQIVEDPVPEVKMITETVSGTRGTGTKVTIANSDGTFAWSAGDNIAAHISNGKYVSTSDTEHGASGASVAAGTASFTVAYEEGYARDAFAVYPSGIVSADAANYGQEGHPLDITLPSEYKLAELTGETTPCPMIATNAPNSGWTFKQLCGFLRLTVNNIPNNAKRLEIDFGGKQVCGAFAIASPVTPGTSAISTSADEANDVITITKDGTDATLGATSLVLNIPLPTGDYDEITVIAYDALTSGKALLGRTVAFSYTAKIARATKRTVSLPTTFRGYRVSTGILERSKVGDADATYSLTSGEMVMTVDPVTKTDIYALPAGCNPFEPAVYYKQSASLDKYFNKWLTLRTELGADGNNILAASDKLPAGWQFPTGGGSGSYPTTCDWGKILYGAPKSPITVNGSTVGDHAYALVTVNLAADSYGASAGTYYGLFLFRDGITIPTGYFTTIGKNSKYTDNSLTDAQFNALIKMGCLFISASGYYSTQSGYGWRELNSSYHEGHYWTRTYYSSSAFYEFKLDDSAGSVKVNTRTDPGTSRYYVVKLVRPVNP